MREETPASGEERIRCARCQVLKPAEAFSLRRGNGDRRDTHCRPCRADYQHEHYVKQRERYVAEAGTRARAQAVERTDYLLDYFEDHPCRDCGETDPLVLEFDHQGDKLFNIGRELRYRSWPAVLAEIEKCEVVCANCHRRRSAAQFGSLRLRLQAEHVLEE